MGLRSLAPGPNTSRKHPAHPVYPYLLRDRVIDAPNQAWCADVAYMPLAHGFVYLVAIMDWHTRHVLSWRLSTTQDTCFCLEALEEALERYGAPAIFSTEQGSQGEFNRLSQHLLKMEVLDGTTTRMDYRADRAGTNAFPGQTGGQSTGD